MVVVYDANLNHHVVSDSPSARCCFQIRTAMGVYSTRLKKPTAYPRTVAATTGAFVAVVVVARADVTAAVGTSGMIGGGGGGGGGVSGGDDDDGTTNPSKNGLPNPTFAEDTVVNVFVFRSGRRVVMILEIGDVTFKCCWFLQ